VLYGGGLLQSAAIVKNGFCGLLADGSLGEDILLWVAEPAISKAESKISS
jgi:hypothetical protein